jgi:hypothetical protein
MNYNILIVKHPVDGLKLAMKTSTQKGKSELIIMTSGGAAAALYFGYETPPSYVGLSAAFQYNIKALISTVEAHGSSYQVLLPTAHSLHSLSHAEYLDRFRNQPKEYRSVTIILDYTRLEQDLPPLTAGDNLACFWEVKDHLTQETVNNFSYLTERLEQDKPMFHGLHFYGRQKSDKEIWAKRKEEISASLGIQSPYDMIEL